MISISDWFSVDLMVPNLLSLTKRGIIFEMSSLLEKHGLTKDLKQLIRDIELREMLGTTGIGSGIAIPHAKTEAIIRPAIVFGKSSSGIAFDALDHQPVHLFFMILVPISEVNLHLKALATLSRWLMQPSFRESLMEAEDPKAMIGLIRKMDEKTSA